MSQGFGSPVKPRRSLPIWAWFVIVPCGCVALFVPAAAILAAILFPVFAQAREKARQVSCASNIRQQALAVRMYSADYDERLPASTAWMNLTYPYYKTETILHCPKAAADVTGAYGYAFNSKLSRQEASKVKQPQSAVLIYDSSSTGRNATDPVTSLAAPPRHRTSNNIGYLDGHVKPVQPSQISQ